MPSQDSIVAAVPCGGDAAVVRLKDAKGLRYLEPLVRQPGRSFHVAELVCLAAGPEVDRPATADGTQAVPAKP
jgi:hypothetical protein